MGLVPLVGLVWWGLVGLVSVVKRGQAPKKEGGERKNAWRVPQLCLHVRCFFFGFFFIFLADFRSFVSLCVEGGGKGEKGGEENRILGASLV